MSFNINEIRGQLRLGGARPTLFQVSLESPFTSELGDIGRFMIQATTLPGSTIPPVQVPYWGRKINVSGDRTFEPWAVSVINDEDFKIRHGLETWHNRINGLSSNLNTTGSAAPSNYKSQAEVRQYSKAGGTPIRVYKFYGLFPIEILPIDLNWANTDTIETFQATFAYDWYDVVGGITGTVS